MCETKNDGVSNKIYTGDVWWPLCVCAENSTTIWAMPYIGIERKSKSGWVDCDRDFGNESNTLLRQIDPKLLLPWQQAKEEWTQSNMQQIIIIIG